MFKALYPKLEINMNFGTSSQVEQLLHDDVVDESALRRGKVSANLMWGNKPSVLVGDFLYSRSFQLMVELDRMEVMRILADTTNLIAEGEVLQLLHVHNPDTDEAAYLRVHRPANQHACAGNRLDDPLGRLRSMQADVDRWIE